MLVVWRQCRTMHVCGRLSVGVGAMLGEESAIFAKGVGAGVRGKCVLRWWIPRISYAQQSKQWHTQDTCEELVSCSQNQILEFVHAAN